MAAFSIAGGRRTPPAAYVLIDVGYLEGRTKDLNLSLEEVSFRELAFRSNVAVNHGNAEIRRVVAYDALGDPPDPLRKRWLDRNNADMDTHVRLGQLKGKQTGRREPRQKGVDIQLAVDALSWAWRGLFDNLILVTGDADFCPLVDALRDAGPHVGLALFQSASNSAELISRADRVGWLPSGQADGWSKCLFEEFRSH